MRGESTRLVWNCEVHIEDTIKMQGSSDGGHYLANELFRLV